jgi:hypothetical protein
LVSSLLETLSTDEINRYARKTGFVKIDSPLDGVTFLKLLFANSEEVKNKSLNLMCAGVVNDKGKRITKQALDARFTKKSILFIKTIFEVYLRKMVLAMDSKTDSGWMDLFNRVLVKDGTRFDLPEAFATYFKGFGGKCTSNSAICIQLEYDLKTGTIVEFKLTSANIPDSKDAQLTMDDIQTGDLILRDLGYSGLNIFEAMIRKGAYFISKLNTQITVFELKNKVYIPLDFKKLYTKMEKMGCKTKEIEVFIGKDNKIPTRLVVELIPEDVYEERIRKNKKENQKKGYKMRAEYAHRQHFNCYITNIEKGILPPLAIRNIYRLRWQIELVFKQWKSTYKIDKTHQMKYERWITLFYARLLLMLIHWQIYHITKMHKYTNKNKLLSLAKCFISLQSKAYKITALVAKGITKIKNTVNELINFIATEHDLETKKGKESQQEIIDIIYCISE